ncbi:uncharacterized protein ARMOST_07542 [Armillaria ostoyae]|uniref:Uncharacterized protein n=1 Tax=Armillaria ostoyae TaxID=47428 RepID=A0A284R674_ARMOS|nr:uncharacterized protein ARMOST_07542 [Armillaria ostoyae]
MGTQTYNQFNTFHYDKETFEGLETDYYPKQPSPLYSVPSPRPLADSPHHLYQYQPTSQQQQHGFPPNQWDSRLIARGDHEAGGSNIPLDPPHPTNAERQQQAAEEAG